MVGSYLKTGYLFLSLLLISYSIFLMSILYELGMSNDSEVRSLLMRSIIDSLLYASLPIILGVGFFVGLIVMYQQSHHKDVDISHLGS